MHVHIYKHILIESERNLEMKSMLQKENSNSSLKLNILRLEIAFSH